MNVFHAGDGNLHPLLVFDAREPGRAGAGARRRRGDRRRRRSPPAACCRASTASASRSATSCRCCSRPTTSTPRPGCATRSTPTAVPTRSKVLPAGSRCGDLPARARRGVDLTVGPRVDARSPSEVGADGPGGRRSAAARSGTSAGRRRRARARCARRPGIVELRAGRDDRARAAPARRSPSSTPRSASTGQCVALPDVAGRHGRRRARRGPQRPAPARATGRCATRCSRSRYVSAEGRLVKAGGPTVKNVSGFDLCRLLVGLARHARPARRGDPAHPAASARRRSGSPATADPFALRRRLLPADRRSCGTATTTWVLLEGHPADVDGRGRVATGLAPVDGPPAAAAAPLVGRVRRRGDAAPALAGRVRRRGRRRRRAPRRRRPPPRPVAAAGRATCTARLKARVRPDRPAQPRAGDVLSGGREARASTTTSWPRASRAGCACRTARPTGSRGEESASPRGRIAAMRAGAAGRRAGRRRRSSQFMDACVQCRGCEPACPSGVPFGHLMEGTRDDARRARPATSRGGGGPATALLGHHRLLLAGSTRAGRRAARCGSCPGAARPAPAAAAPAPRCGRPATTSWLFTGCVMDAWQRDVHAAAPAGARGRRRRRRPARRRAATAAARCTRTPGSRDDGRALGPAGRWRRCRATRPSSSTRPGAARR